MHNISMNIDDLKEIHRDTFDKCFDIMVKKNSDYTGGKNSTDPFANFRSSEVLGIHPVVGILMRVMDKLQRVRSFTNDGKLQVADESVYDACEDVVNYMIIAKALLIEERSTKTDNENNSKKDISAGN